MCALRIVVDDACEVPADLAAQRGMPVVPLVVRFGEEVYDDGTITRDEFWAKAETVAHPQTSQPAPARFEQAFRSVVEAGDEVLCVAITSKHSGTYNSAWLAAQQFPGKVTVFDSHFVSWGSAFLALEAADMADAGEPVGKIVRHLEACREAVQFPILLNTVEWIRKGGRADRLIPMLERVLRVFNIKPILTFGDGELKILGTVRSYERGLTRLMELTDARAPYKRLAIFHTRQPEAAQEYADRVAQRFSFPREQIFVAEVGPAISSHVGPKAMAIIGLPANL